MITLDNKRIHDYIVEKDALVDVGRGISRELEKIENKIQLFEKREKVITAKVVPPAELTEKGDRLMKIMNDTNKELEELVVEINKLKLAAIPKDMKEEHEALMRKRDELETERNKIALKVQKIKDKLVPVIQKVVKPLLKDLYDDIETAKTKDGKVVISTFNHLEDWKRAYAKK